MRDVHLGEEPVMNPKFVLISHVMNKALGFIKRKGLTEEFMETVDEKYRKKVRKAFEYA